MGFIDTDCYFLEMAVPSIGLHEKIVAAAYTLNLTILH
jgi:hypothetical protein